MALVESAIVGLFFAWVAFVVGVLIGWTWKPRRASHGGKAKLRCLVPKPLDLSVPPSPSLSVSSPLKGFGSAPCLNALICDPWAMPIRQETRIPSVASSKPEESKMNQTDERLPNTVTEEDLGHLVRLVEKKDGGPPWMQLMDRSTSGMQYQAWWRETKTGPTEYRSRTVFEDATPELVRDFFWDDEFRPKWDNMLADSCILEECPKTGTMIVKWIRKFPFFCSDREYIIGRRIWNCEQSYYCITKGVSLPSIPRNDKPRRVDLYYSSWCIRAVESRRGDGLKTSCEVILFHHEDMGIPRELAKLGVRQGMWGAVKKMEPGFCSYQKERFSGGGTPSHSAAMAQINSKITAQHLNSLADRETSPEAGTPVTSNQQHGPNIPKLVILCGAVLVACSLSKGLLPSALVVGFGRRFANAGRRRQLEAGPNA
ncbi:PREDICTED: uncharacterized protein LOC104804742 [Tarenaya hassleriana]|uniref:uncharacterized protein LOC104804742 n=1 Tax=Tarenaya hassleriana TaxID=28532 RepID=UPI0008FD22C8|nr:PREDICTED: uncharacterized protein LOC104804742 [Tarenaya hassleriana]